MESRKLRPSGSILSRCIRRLRRYPDIGENASIDDVEKFLQSFRTAYGFEVMGFLRLVLLVVFVSWAGAAKSLAQGVTPARFEQLEQKVQKLVKEKDETGLVLILFGAFCALWAQNTGRSAWLWFFLGLIFSPFAVIALLWKNSDDNASKRRLERIRQM